MYRSEAIVYIVIPIIGIYGMRTGRVGQEVAGEAEGGGREMSDRGETCGRSALRHPRDHRLGTGDQEEEEGIGISGQIAA